MKRIVQLIVLAFGLMTTCVFAGVPCTIDYQGRLMDATGKPIADSENNVLIISLYTSDQSKVLWTKTYTAVPTRGGYFNLALGDETAAWKGLDFNQQYFIGTQVGGDNQELSPRQALKTAPYAMSVPDGAITKEKLSPDACAFILPIGTILPWHGSMTGTPALPPDFVECNGQTLNAEDSPYNGQVIPNLNGKEDGSCSPGLGIKAQMFLRGGTTSGVGQMDCFQGHRHSPLSGTILNWGCDGPNIGATWAGNMYMGGFLSTGNPVTDGVNGVPRTASETRPVNMSIIWIMKIK